VRIIEVGDVDRSAELSLRLALVEQQMFAIDVVDAAEILGAADRPVDRRRRNSQRPLHIVDEFERIASRTIELVDERQNRQAVAAAHLEQLARLILDAVGRVDDHHHAIGGDQGAIGVLAEVLVARRVEERHAAPVELEFEGRGGDRNAALLFERHPVRRRMAPRLAAAHGAGQLDRARVEQQLFGERRLAGVGMRDDRERPPARDLAFQLRRGGRRGLIVNLRRRAQVHTGGGVIVSAGVGPGSGRPEPSRRLIACTVMSWSQRIWHERRTPVRPRAASRSTSAAVCCGGSPSTKTTRQVVQRAFPPHACRMSTWASCSMASTRRLPSGTSNVPYRSTVSLGIDPLYPSTRVTLCARSGRARLPRVAPGCSAF
jgi:hypothetical protein